MQEVLVATDLRPWDPHPDEASAALCGKTARTKRRNGAYPSDTERVVHWRTSLKDWPVNFGNSYTAMFRWLIGPNKSALRLQSGLSSAGPIRSMLGSARYM